MGRKIPTRRHMGVRDLLVQKGRQEALIKDKINNPPEKRDFQKVSHSLARFIQLKDAAKQDNTNKSKNQRKIKQNIGVEDRPENYGKNKKMPGSSEARNDKQLPTLKQKAGESDYKFLRRINTETRNAHEEANFEAKYGVEVVHDKKTGAIKLKKRPRNEIDERIKQNLENHKRAKRGQKMQPNKVLAPEEKKKLVKQALVEKKEKEREEAKSQEVKEFKRDEFKFGEVVMAPPTLSVPRRATKAETVPRPGQKPLLLHSVIENYSDPKEEEKAIDKVAPSAIQKASNKATSSLKGKRKEMSMAMRHMIEKEQSNVIEMYKQLKKSQRQQSKNKE